MKQWKSLGGDSWVLGRMPVAFAVALTCAIALLVWVSYRSTRDWQRQTALVLQERQAEVLALASTAIARDMRGMWTTVIAPINVFELEEDAPYELMQTAARAFARFPYPESFVVWKNADTEGPSTFVFHRTERYPPWEHAGAHEEPFPVTIARDPGPLSAAMDLVRDIKPSTRFVAINVDVAGIPYQIVAHRMFSSRPPHQLNAMVAFTVNLEWVGREYFGPLLHQLAQIAGNQDNLSLSVLDGQGHEVAASAAASSAGRDLGRPFPMLFLDAAVASPFFDGESAVREWSIHVRPSVGNPLLSAQQGTRYMFYLLALAATLGTTALLMTVRAARASATLASMQSDFVAAVTHELKTPVAAIRLVGDTLARHRYASVETVADYARLLSQEAARLSRLIDGLLMYSKYTAWRDTPDARNTLEIADVVEDALEGLRPMLDQLRFDLTVDLPRTLPPVAGDRPALVQVMECVIDNAMKYCADLRTLTISGRNASGRVHISFADQGIGIPPEDIGRVFDRFYRGRNVSKAGSGLGLTIARRIIQAHRGTIELRSTMNIGTSVEVSLPAAKTS